MMNELKGLFSRYKNKIIGPFNPEKPNFTKDLIRELNLGLGILSSNTQKNSRNLFIMELNLIFYQLNSLPFSMKDPEDPNFTHFLLDFIKHFDFYKSGIQLTKDNLLEFKRILRVIHSDPSVWENNPEKEDFIWDLLYAINSPEVICTSCGGKIHDKMLKNKVLGLRKKVAESNYKFSIAVPIYCCKCFKLPLESNNLDAVEEPRPHIRSQDPRLRLNSLRTALMMELQRLFAARRQIYEEENTFSNMEHNSHIENANQLNNESTRTNIQPSNSQNNSQDGEPRSLIEELRLFFARRSN